MLDQLSRLAHRRPSAVVVVALAFAGVAAAFGLGIAAHLGPAGFSDPATDSARADSVLAVHGGQDTGLLILVRGGGQAAGDSAAAVERDVRDEPLVSDVAVTAGSTRPGTAADS